MVPITLEELKVWHNNFNSHDITERFVSCITQYVIF